MWLKIAKNPITKKKNIGQSNSLLLVFSSIFVAINIFSQYRYNSGISEAVYFRRVGYCGRCRLACWGDN
jgi:hypothetical protein